MNTKRVGNIGEAAAIAEFVRFGIPIYLPFGDNETSDIVAEFGGKFQKIQVKTTSAPKGDRIEFKLGVRRYGHDYKYDSCEVDYFVLHCVETRGTYIVKNTEDFNGRAVTFRLTLPERGQRAKIRLAEDYTFDKMFG